MKRTAVVLALVGAFGGAAWAGDYNADGKTFGKGQLDKIKSSVSDKNAKDAPHYTNDPPQKASYGATSLLNVGKGRITSCKTSSKTGNAVADQECEAVNFLAGNPRAHFDLTPNDPAVIAGRVIAGNAAGLADQITGGQNCTDKTTTTPPEKSIETCAEYLPVEQKECSMGWNVDVNADSNFQCDQTYKSTEYLFCQRTLHVACNNGGAEMSDASVTKNSPFTDVSITPVPETPGLYNYRLGFANACGTEGTSQINFNFDTVGAGGYVTINVAGLDDTAIVAVNNKPVFAGHPNSGPEYHGSWFPTNASVDMGYRWTEMAGQVCDTWQDMGGGEGGNYVCTHYTPTYQTYTATAKLMDTCPSGYSPSSQMDFMYWCDDSGYCHQPDPYTPYNVQGFFCNSEGKFLLNRAEGTGNWGGTVDATMPLKTGANKLFVYWGTNTSGKACGRIQVTGQIYNVKQQCTTSWEDNCGELEERTK
ncbi:hypothetical protein [Methylibium petroleiphilum]|uniref:Uncharacterized protein n=1 Tax=Methylibium petroleiphilum (strain ATCC BAA-1232 / LMG 22953 / PM1) TaxID=420662 RepID=A2SNL8_METPP|nr:hypothetical protein [Methylibium petroleiphilum]ABM97157.1 hypothetical protein Mpe_B0382 [Methylibium petroleiphilum PM1]